MKILLLLFLTLLIVGCGTTEEPYTVQEPSAETMPLFQPLQPDENASEIRPDEDSVSVPLDEPYTRHTDEPYTGDIFYFTKLPAVPSDSAKPEDETVLPSPEPADTYHALAAVIFDYSELPSWNVDNFKNTVIFCPDELPNRDSPQYLRMNTDGIVYAAAPGKFTSPMGYTADGIPYVWETREYLHDWGVETGTEYVVSLLLSGTDMVNLSFYTNSYDEDFENDFLRPHLDACRTWIPEKPLTVRFHGLDNNQSPAAMTADFTLPDTWILENTGSASDTKLVHTGQYSIKRMDKPAFSTEHFTGYEPFHATLDYEPFTGTTAEGFPYIVYRRDPLSVFGEPLGVSWYFVSIGHPNRYLTVAFLSYEDDPADYFDTVILPVIESVHIVPTE